MTACRERLLPSSTSAEPEKLATYHRKETQAMFEREERQLRFHRRFTAAI